jgi:cysteine-rich repeat protein
LEDALSFVRVVGESRRLLLILAAFGAAACGGKLDLNFVGSPAGEGGDGNTVSATCGDRKVDKGEDCDDGDRADGDGCDGTCAVEDGWTCTGEPSMCVKCGNGDLEAGEECDDGNSDDGDGCTAQCKIEGACAAPIPIALTEGKSGLSGSVTSNTSKTDTGQVDAADCGGASVGAGADRVFEFELQGPADVDVRVGSNFDSVVRLMKMPCDTATEVPNTCADAGAVAEEEVVHVDSLPAGKYYVVVDGKTAQQAGSFSVNVEAHCPLDGLKIDRVILAEPFRTVIFNSNEKCSIDLSRVGIYAQPEAADGPKTLPAVSLDPLKRRVLTSESPPPQGTTYQGDVQFASDGYAGAVYLCRGACDLPRGSNVFDAFRWAGDSGKPKNAPLTAVTFDANAPALTDRATMSYYRIARDGAPPSFKAGDYVGAYFAETFEDASLLGWEMKDISAVHYTTSFNAPMGTLGSYALELDRKDSPVPVSWNGPRALFRDNTGAPMTIKPSYISLRVRASDKTLEQGYAYFGALNAETDGAGSYLRAPGHIAFGPPPPATATFISPFNVNTWYTIEYRNITPVGAGATADVFINNGNKAAGQAKITTLAMSQVALRSQTAKSQVWYDQIIVR